MTDDQIASSVATPTRRRVLTLAGVATLLLGAPGLAACSSQDDDSATASAEGATVLRIAAPDATNSSGLDPRTTSQGASVIVLEHVYDSLVTLEDGAFELSLAESVEPNDDGSSWTIALRDGVQFHDGRPVRAQDVAFSLAALAGKESNRASVYADVDAANLEVVDDLTLEVPLLRPRGDFREAVLGAYSPIFPDGTTDFAQAIGSGPYRLQSQDERAVRLVANDDYWDGAPKIGTVEILRIADPAARLSAVESGQVDYAVGISAAGARTASANDAMTVHSGGAANSNALSFAMNQTLPPFDDPRVRQAVRLAADRPALVETALGDFGETGADVVGKGLPGYSSTVVERERDVDEARRLFQEAGVSKLTLRAADLVPGMLTAAQLLKQQLEEAGVTLTVAEVPLDSFYADVTALGTHPFQTFYYTNRPAAVHLAATTTKTAVFNVTGAGADHWRKLDEAQRLIDDEARARAFDEIEDEFYADGGDLLWGYQETVDVSRNGIEGVTMSESVPKFDRATLTRG